jgi:hypothetical protein
MAEAAVMARDPRDEHRHRDSGTALAVTVDNKWVALLQAFLAGTAAISIVHSTHMITMPKSFEAMVRIVDEMREINEALIHDRVAVHFQSIGIAPDDDGPPATHRLH